MQVVPSILDIAGAMSIFLSALAITFEKEIFMALCGRCCIKRTREQDEDHIFEEDEEEGITI